MSHSSSHSHVPPPDCVAWVRRANRRWIVHGGLGQTAEAYLDHLARTDPSRLEHSCRNAYRLVRESGPIADPKPWFYCGLFSLAHPAEARQYLADHWLIASVLADPSQPPPTPQPGRPVSPATTALIQQIRQSLLRLTGPHPTDPAI